MTETIVDKYGGTSVSAPEDITRIDNITRDDYRRQVIVVSAPAGVTQLLIELAKDADPEKVSEVVNKFQTAHPGTADTNQIKKDLMHRLECGLPSEEREDYIKSFGEYTNARLIAQSLGYEFMDSADILQVTPRFGNAEIEPASRQKLRRALKPGKVYIIPGFYGRTKDDRIATFSRGGSDLTGSYVAAALDAVIYENFTDRPGVFTADPREVPAAMKIPVLTFKEMRDLAYSGAKIFHPDAILPIEDRLDEGKAITVHVRSSKEYPVEGTFIVSERTSNPLQPVVGIAYGDAFCSFDIEMRGLNNMIGVTARIAQIFAELNLSIEHLTTGIDDLSVILKKDQLEKEVGQVSNVESRLKRLLGIRGYISFQEHMGCLVVAGKGIKQCSTAISRRMLHALENAGVDTIFTEKGPSKSCIISGIPSKHKKRAMNAVHEEFFRNGCS
ncbi:aspartate kinase [Candidatus Woesearchaeota archaeon]|nr:aspartate kinase [Candidatus Woesearchaeota archaeon]